MIHLFYDSDSELNLDIAKEYYNFSVIKDQKNMALKVIIIT